MARNQYAGCCYLCGHRVEAGTGFFEKRRRAKGWRVRHADAPGDGRVTCEMAEKQTTMDRIFQEQF